MEPSTAPRSRRRQEAWRWLALFAVPAAYLAATIVATREVRPLWMGGAVDPTYPYLLNALLVAEGRAPALATHPGTPMQVIGAVVQHAAHALSGFPLGLRRHVLTDPEYFVDAWRGLLVALTALACVAQGRAALRLSGSLLCAVASQAAPLASAWVVPASILVMPEVVILAVGFLSSALILRSLRRTPEPSLGDAALIGLLLGLAIATKILYGSLALLPLIWLPRARHRGVYVAALLAAFALGVAPLGPRLPAIAVWLYQALVHTGAWGAGPPGVIVLGTYPAALITILRGEPLIHGVTVLLALAAVAASRSRDPGVVSVRHCAWGLVATATVSVLLAAKQSAIVTYYHMPVVALAGLGLTLAYRLFATVVPASRLPRTLLAVWLAASLGYQAWWLHGFVDRRRPVRPAAEEAARIAAATGGDRTLHGYSVSSLGSALTFANEWSGRSFSADLRALYPHAFSYDWAGLHLFGRPLAVAELDALRVDGDSFVLWDAAWWPYSSWDWFRGASVQPLGGHERDRLFKARLAPLDEGSAAGAPPFAGLLILTGSSDRPSLERAGTPYIEPLGPITRLAVLATGPAASLEVECRYTGTGTQTLHFKADGEEVQRLELAPSESWRALSVALPARPGLATLDVEYERLLENPAAARPRFPGYAEAVRDVRWPAVQYRRLQVRSGR